MRKWGAYLLGLWGFSDDVVGAIAYHHAASRSGAGKFDSPGLLHVADRLAHHSGPGRDALTEADLETGIPRLDRAPRTPRRVAVVWAKAGA